MMLIYDGENMILSTDWILTINAKKGRDFSGVYYRRKSGNAAEDMGECFLCGYPDFEMCKKVVEDIAFAIENGAEIYSIERWTKDDQKEWEAEQKSKAAAK